MSVLYRSASAIDKTLSSTTGKAKSLNPDAAEFVPFALRSPSGNTNAADTSSSFSNFGGKSTPNKSESSVSFDTDDVAHQFWRDQLPDDITPDFNVVRDSEEESQGINSIPFSNLSLTDVNRNLYQINGGSYTEKIKNLPSYGETSVNVQQKLVKAWDMNGDQLFTGVEDEFYYNGDQFEGTEVNSLEFLVSRFPGFSAESLGEVYYANGCDFNLTIEMLTQLELQVDNGLNQNLNSKALSAPNLSALDFPALSPTDNHNNTSTFSQHDQQQNINNYCSLEKELLMFKSSSTAPSLGATDFASAVRKTPHDSSIWKYDKSHSPYSTIGSSRSSHHVTGAYGRSGYGDRLGNRSSTRSSPVWLETGEAVANMYSDMRGEARDHARLRNAYFEQARQAYLVGHKALAKELSGKGQLHNMQMKAAHEKAQESIYYQRLDFISAIYFTNRSI